MFLRQLHIKFLKLKLEFKSIFYPSIVVNLNIIIASKVAKKKESPKISIEQK